MSNYANTKATIDANVYTNGNNEVTAAMVNAAIDAVVDTIIAGGFLYKGVAHPADAAVTPDANCFWIATEAGTYTNKNGYVLDGTEAVIIKYNGSWSKEDTGIKLVSVSQNTSTGHTDITVGGTTTPVASLYDLGYLTYSKATTAPYGDLALGFAFENGKDYLFVNKSDSVSVNVYNGETLITTMSVGSQYLYHATANGNAAIATGVTGTMNFEVHCNLEKRVLDNENNIAELQSDSNKVLNHIMESHSYNVTAGTGKTVHGTKTLTNGKQYQIIFNEGADLISTLVVFNTAYTTYVAIPISSDKVAFTANFDGAFDLVCNSGAVIGTGTLDYDIIDNPFTLEDKVDDNARGIETLEDSKANAVKSKNLLNPNTLNVGHFYWNYGNETAIGDNANYAITDFIPINGHNIKANWVISGGMANCVFDANKTFLRKITTNDYEYQSGDAYIRYTTASNPKNRQFQLEYGSASTPYEPYTDKLDVYQLSQEYTDNEIGKVKGVDIIVKKDGTGDYTSVVDAVNYANGLSSDGVVRNIHIYEGEYDIFDELGGQTWLDNHTTMYGYAGLFPKNNVNLIGHGLVILKTILPTTINQSQGAAISGLSLSHYNNRIENIVVVAQNTRYACHDESDGYGDEITRVVKNCTFILLPRTAEHAWQYMTAYGGGTTVGGATYDFIDCRFMSSTGNAWSFHTNENAKPMYFNVDGCFGYCSGDLSFRASYYSTGQVGTTFFNIKNCTGNGGVEKRAETAQSTDHIVLFNNGYQSISSEDAESIYNQIINSLDLE